MDSKISIFLVVGYTDELISKSVSGIEVTVSAFADCAGEGCSVDYRFEDSGKGHGGCVQWSREWDDSEIAPVDVSMRKNILLRMPWPQSAPSCPTSRSQGPVNGVGRSYLLGIESVY